MSRILVVDDEPQIVRALDIHLRARGYEVATASDGTEALQAAASRVPDLVILDLGLPDLDGVEVITGLRGWSSVPILVLSGRADSVDKVDAFDAGADDYVTKPFGMDEPPREASRDVAAQHTDGRPAEGDVRRGVCRPDGDPSHRPR